jgi:hypothetical protein
MGTNSTGCSEWERDFDHVTEQPHNKPKPIDPFARIEALEAALRFYQCEAEALARYLAEGKENKSDAIMASVTVLSLDAGRRASAALALERDK